MNKNKNIKIKPEVVRRRVFNKINRKFRDYVEVLYESRKYRPDYKFINYAIYLIWDDSLVTNYIMTSVLESTDENNLLGDKDQFELAINIFNIGRNININNRCDGIDAIDKELLIRNFDLVIKPFEEELIKPIRNDIQKSLKNEILKLKDLEG